MKLKSLMLVAGVLFLAYLPHLPGEQKTYPYQDPARLVEARVKDLLARMTREEKCWQLFMIPGDLSDGKEKYRHGVCGLQVSAAGSSENVSEQRLRYGAGGAAAAMAEQINEIQRYFVEETRLGIPIIPFDEALHGLARDGATAFPQAIGLAASWDLQLMEDVAAAIARETRRRGIRQVLSPVVNIARDVRWGRVEETYGEDPFLTSQMGVAYVREFAKAGVIATPKHFVANVGDGGRDSYPVHLTERLLEEVCFPAFKACLQQGGARAVMTAYNSLDGTPCAANSWLLQEKLKQAWGFTGFVMADAGAVPGLHDLHGTAADYAAAARQAIEHGLDVIFQTDVQHFPLVFPVKGQQAIDGRALDDAVARVLRAKFALGLFDDPYVDPRAAAAWNGHPSHRALAEKAARESIVLLKNDRRVLPFRENVRAIAVIGTDAVEARLGGYSGPGNDPVNILDGITRTAGAAREVHYTPGVGRAAAEHVPIPAENLCCEVDGQTERGLWGEYFTNIALQDPPALARVDPAIDFRWTLFSPQPDIIPKDGYSIRWTGRLKAPETGDFKIGIAGNDGYRFYINDELVIDNWRKQTRRARLADYHLVKDQTYNLKIEYFEPVGNGWITLVWNVGVNPSWEHALHDAVRAAETCDVAVVVAGIEEGEFRDRARLGLPGHQAELIRRIAAIGKPTVVVLVGGGAVVMNGWIDAVDAVLCAWYPGEAGGPAVADVLFGRCNPAGRLPITFPLHEGQLPLYYSHKPTGRGDDYVNLPGTPLFPFGYGLSYTTFEYEDLVIEKPVIGADERTSVRFRLTNTGALAGDEVVQLYINDVLASVARPVLELKGFQRIHLPAGETKVVEFEITPDLLSMLDQDLHRVVEPGDFRLMIGASSVDIRLKGTLTVK
jgi:beta-glucosidase